jgi:anthranilate/para-aminobenzoate synthase component I
MELFLHKEGEKLTSKPIKGTLPITENPERFKELEKELAENLMITDMVRNDLGRVARVGSVKVSSLFEVESYKTLHQLVSTVECKTDATFEEIIRATFPPASVSGAPKRRAVEIIAEIEPHAREIYCGTVGVIKPNGDFVANVSIRTAILRENTLSYYAGGGIVYDSDPEREWREVNLKAEAFLKAIGEKP